MMQLTDAEYECFEGEQSRRCSEGLTLRAYIDFVSCRNVWARCIDKFQAVSGIRFVNHARRGFEMHGMVSQSEIRLARVVLLCSMCVSGALSGATIPDHTVPLVQESEPYTISRLVAAKDGNTLLTFVGDGSVKSYTISNGGKVSLIDGNDSTAGLVGALTADGRYILFVENAIFVKRLDRLTGKIITLGFHRELVTNLECDESGHFCASGAQDGTVKLWSLTAPSLNRAMQIGSGPLSISFLERGEMIAIQGAGEKTIQIFETVTGKMHATVSISSEDASTTISSCGQDLLIATASRLSLWDAVKQQVVWQKPYLQAESPVCNTVAQSIVFAISHSGRSELYLISKVSGDLISHKDVHGYVSAMCLGLDNMTLFVAADYIVDIYEMESLERLREFIGTNERYSGSIIFQNGGPRLAIGGEFGIQVWRADLGAREAEIPSRLSSKVQSVNADESIIAIVGADVVKIDPPPSRRVQTIWTTTERNATVTTNSSASLIVASTLTFDRIGARSANALIVRPRDGASVRINLLPNDPVHHILPFENGTRFAISFQRGKLCLWRTEPIREEWCRQAGKGSSPLAVTSDGNYLAASTAANTVTLFDTTDGGVARVFARYDPDKQPPFLGYRPVNSLAFSADGRHLAGGSWMAE